VVSQCSPPTLQWGRPLSRAESGHVASPSLAARPSFNGAALFREQKATA